MTSTSMAKTVDCDDAKTESATPTRMPKVTRNSDAPRMARLSMGLSASIMSVNPGPMKTRKPMYENPSAALVSHEQTDDAMSGAMPTTTNSRPIWRGNHTWGNMQ